MRIAVLGPGGVGGFVAAALARDGRDVVVVAREPTAQWIGEHGIAVQSVVLGDFGARPRGAAELDVAADVLLVATKATVLEQALERVAVAPELVVPLLNGVEHMTVLRDRFGAGRVAAGVIRIDSDRPQIGRIVQSSPTVRIDLAADDDALSGRLRELASALEHAGLAAQLGDSEAQILWSKLVRLNALACTTSASGETIGFIRSDPAWRALLEACIRETAAVAAAEGASIDPAARLAELDQAHAELGSSMQRDIAAGRVPELDAIAGAVMRTAARHGLSCPTVARLCAQIAARAGIPMPAVPAIRAV
ncbi:MAG: 2-dehydropantoate 2-reductase [Actinomycetota bacterium]|nr:2-dehydropantoate 2-reductase [Actinomycetota bacterium]